MAKTFHIFKLIFFFNFKLCHNKRNSFRTCTRPHLVFFKDLWSGWAQNVLGKLLGAKYLKTIGHILDYIRYFAASWECVCGMAPLTIVRPWRPSQALYSHCYFIRLNPKRISPFQFCLPALLGIHRNPRQKDIFKSSKRARDS